MLKSIQKLLVIGLLLGGCGGAPSNNADVVVSPTPDEPTASPAAVAPTPTVEAAPAESPIAAESATIDTTVVPGERVGAVTRETTRADLAALFGEENIRDEEIDVGEGFTESGTVVDLGDRSFSVIWTDSSRSQPALVQNFGTAWQTPEGIGISTSFPELQTILGEFQLYGFGWDYGGTVVLDGTPLDQYDGLLVLRVQPSGNSQASADYKAVAGDSLYPSNDTHFQSLDLQVESMIVYLTPPS
ncbi:MAG: hypothetical protein HC881_04135 [Leptolyngbyaceae cyanobacterium SL_7_1]|nr:hypothetical protein [Leptolyngbyaceae cyanobacterium SL_7_1]